MSDLHVDVDFQQKYANGEIICGDVFHTRRIIGEGRYILILSDGLGHGIRANVMATLTASMAMKYTSFHTRPEIAANIFMRVLPQNSDNKESYATFTIIEIDNDELVRIINYDNPTSLIFRNGKPFVPRELEIPIRGEENKEKILRIREFTPIKGDRIIFMTDGVTQSGLGGKRFQMGWGESQISSFAQNQLEREPEMTATRLARKIINQAAMNDGFKMKDDASCGVLNFRVPREFMLITGPPFYKIKDMEFVDRVRDFSGKKIICGGTTGEIIARELQLDIEIQHHYEGDDIPPAAEMEGFEMVTEGILTLGRVEEILEKYNNDTRLENTPPEEVAKLLLEHDIIHILLGTRINRAHQDPEQPFEVQIRKFVVKRIVKLLEERFFKKVFIEFI
ncbi:SpoIIE family protein phosphatase [Mangrovibacterium sp.]|uniref:SpoIIE family protein phosphatase n=1 Tax=Mangrovibacterium sp. TaxID=1961364 RepID=UPI003562296A